MAKKNIIFVRIVGTGFNQVLKCHSHDIMGLPAGTYHKFEMDNGSTIYINDFGIRSVTVADAAEDLN